MINNLFKKLFLLIIILEASSFLAFKFPNLEPIFLGVFLLGFLIILIKNYYFGLILLFLELFISPKGRHLDLMIGNFSFSLRMGIYLSVMIFWLFQILKNKNILQNIKNIFIQKKYYFIYFLFIFIFFGLINGIFNQKSIKIIYSDINAWLYFLLIFPIIYNLDNLRNNKKKILEIFFVAATWISFKTLLLAYIFSHSFFILKTNLYYWTRTAGLGEISDMPNGFVRIFFQTQIFPLILIFYYLIKLFLREKINIKNNYLDFIYLIILLAVTVVSWARSNWIGLFVVLIIFYLLIFIVNKKRAIINFLFLLSGLVLAVALVFGIINFPFPHQTANFNINDLRDRAVTVDGEAAVSSRWSLLPVLKNAIAESPIFGKGFGFEVEYKSSDPRILERSPAGIFKTYIYEWGWLDLWLKLGAVGVMAYLYLIYKLALFELIASIKGDYSNLIKSEVFLSLGLLLLAGIHFFSPYLNHPLGIGFILFVFIFYDGEPGEKVDGKAINQPKNI